jgi:hypothetical protein
MIRPLNTFFVFLALIVVSAHASDQSGALFPKHPYEPKPLPTFADSRNHLPSPILEANPEWVAMYWKTWELAFDHLRQPRPGTPFVVNYIDEAYNDKIYQWDTIFMVMFWRYGHAVFPAIDSLDNFYARQHADGYICRAILEWGPQAGEDRYPPTHDWAINPPLFSWAEVEHYRVSGDLSRFRAVLPVLEAYVGWLEKHRVKAAATHGLYWNTPMGSGMDNTPQTGSAWVEMSAQMVRQYDDLAFMADALGETAKAAGFRARAAQISERMNRLMWDAAAGTYWNLDDEGRQQPCWTIGFSWTLMAGVASPAQACRLAAHLMDPAKFYRPVPFASLAATEPKYTPKGGYWLGSSWAPTTYQAIKGLERYGFEIEAAATTDRYLAALAAVFAKTGTLWENYAPDALEPGDRSKPDFVGWTGLGPVALLIENVIGLRPDAAHRRLVWHLRRTDRHGIERLRIGDTTLDLFCTDRASADAPASVTLRCDRPFTVELIHPGGITTISLAAGETRNLVFPTTAK